MLKAIKKTRIYEEVVNQIHDLIQDGRLKPGAQLPSERELAETFKVSRASVREALRALEAEGLVTSRTGMGTFVAELPLEPLVAALAAVLSKKKGALADIFEMRRLIEPQIASLAAERATQTDIKWMNQILDKQAKEVGDGAPGVEASLQTPGRNQASLNSHRNILSAIEAHDKDQARKAMTHHIQQVEQNVLTTRKSKAKIVVPGRDLKHRRVS
jgi:GntR family transcriptional repressor for pyruvate dehydrogenase complex